MKHKMDEYREIRHDYINQCRRDYGYGQRSKIETLSSSTSAGFTSAMFGSLVTIVCFATFDPHGFTMMLNAIADFSTIQFLEGVFSPLRGLFLDPWSNIF